MTVYPRRRAPKKASARVTRSAATAESSTRKAPLHSTGSQEPVA
ncbi:MAG TPA: hypothetical protein VNC61_10520 [Acidimicrobiales bacterium]|nr:hypothetical protein [Acidimicrobiales bacterium]